MKININRDVVENYAIYFHPTFINVNMTFERIHSNNYADIAYSYDMFLCTPFLKHDREIRIPFNYINRIKASSEDMIFELTAQRDAYWSCRGKFCFIEIMTLLEKIYSLKNVSITNKNNIVSSRRMDGLQKAIQFIESNYNKDIAYSDILLASELNHTDFAASFKNIYKMTAFKYFIQSVLKLPKNK